MALIRRIGFTRFDRWGENLGRLTVSAATHADALDGTDELGITCAEDLAKGDRIVWIDFQGVCHEHIVDSVERTHDDSDSPATKATCINSINETWDDWIDDKRPSGGVSAALASIIAGTRWEVGTCDQDGSASRTFYHESVREGLAGVVETWGGELETLIVHNGSGIVSRRVGVRAKRGDQGSAKRFTWTKDLLSVKRSVASDNPKTRIYGYGKGVETEGGGYGRRLTFGDINGGKNYVEDAEATAIWGHPDGEGGTLPAVASYVNEQCEDAEQLLRETKDHLEQAKEPKVTYTASVIDLYAFGRSWEGVGVGDAVAIIDKGFSEDGVRLHGRVSQIERDLLTGDATVTFGTLTDAMADMWQGVSSALSGNSQQNAIYDAAAGTSVSWLKQLQSALNAQFNAVGTYKVETFELGTMWSNVPLDQETGLPVKAASGMWAVNVNGMGLRLASSLTPGGEWDWRTFLTGGGVSADCINSGSIDAALVKIRNLLTIGDDQDGIKIGKSQISFSVDGKDGALSIKSLPYSVHSDFRYNSNGTYLLKSPSDGSSYAKKFWYTDRDPYIDTSLGSKRAYIKLVITAFIGGSPKIISAEGYLPFSPNAATEKVRLAGSQAEGFEVNAYVTNVGAMGYNIILYKADPENIVYTVYASYRAKTPSGEITCMDGSTFLTDKNIPAFLHGGNTFSGQICIPFFYNNFARNHNMYFQNGVLVHYEQLTAADEGFRDQY